MEFVKDDGSYGEIDSTFGYVCFDIGDLYLVGVMLGGIAKGHPQYTGVSRCFTQETQGRSSQDIGAVLKNSLVPMSELTKDGTRPFMYEQYILGPREDLIKDKINKHYGYYRVTDIHENKWLVTESDVVGC